MIRSRGSLTQYYDLPLRPVIQDLFAEHDALVVFLPVGAAVRLLAPVLDGKKTDPAVVCVDDAGRYAVSVLSGHVGGADALAHRVADAIGAQPVVTSASDALSVTAIDLVGRDQGWRIETSPVDLTRAAAAVVNGEPVALWLDPETAAAWPDDAPLSESIVRVNNPADVVDPRFAAVLIVSDRLTAAGIDRPVVTYRPPTLVAGIGCRRGVTREHLRDLLENTLRQHGLSILSLAGMATADIKADEAGIIALADELSVPLETYDGTRLNEISVRRPQRTDEASTLHWPTASAARSLLGVFGVAEPAAMLASGAEGVIVPRAKSDRATIAVARIPSAKGNQMEASAMNQPDTALPGEALLAVAEREIGKGNLWEGAGLVWQATMEALAAVAAHYDMPCSNREEAVKVVNHLDDIAGAPAPGELYTYRNLVSFSVADSYREEHENQEDLLDDPELQWEPDEYILYLASVRRFIKSLNNQAASDTKQ